MKFPPHKSIERSISPFYEVFCKELNFWFLPHVSDFLFRCKLKSSSCWLCRSEMWHENFVTDGKTSSKWFNFMQISWKSLNIQYDYGFQSMSDELIKKWIFSTLTEFSTLPQQFYSWFAYLKSFALCSEGCKEPP